jgi:hypothetical protein
VNRIPPNDPCKTALKKKIKKINLCFAKRTNDIKRMYMKNLLAGLDLVGMMFQATFYKRSLSIFEHSGLTLKR